jgi:sugar lactone lactonase YvrE
MSVYLATRGKQDYFLTERPEFTFFQKTYERDVQHENTIANVPFDSGAGTIATIPANGDYAAEITLKVTLPALKPQTNYWTFIGTPPSGYIAFYQNNNNTPILTLSSSQYLPYISSAGNFLFKYNKLNTTVNQVTIQASFLVAAYSTDYYLVDLTLLTISKNGGVGVDTGLLNVPYSTYDTMAIKKDGTYIYIADWTGGNIVRVKTSDMTVNSSFVTGLTNPLSVSIDNSGKLYVLCGALNSGSTIVIINTSNGSIISTITLPNALGYLLTVDGAGKYIYVLYANNGITRIDTTNSNTIQEYYISGIGTTVITDIQIDSSGIIYLPDFNARTIIAVDTQSKTVIYNYITNLPILTSSLSITSSGTLYMVGYADTLLVTVETNKTTADFIIFDNIDIANYYCFKSPALTQLLGGYYKYSLPVPSSTINSMSYLDECGWAHSVRNELMKNPAEMVTSPDGTLVYFVDSGNSTIRQMSTSSPYAVTTIAGTPGITGSTDGPGSAAMFSNPQGLAIRFGGLYLYVADTQNSTIRRILNGYPYYVETIAGKAGITGNTNDPSGYNARFNFPQALAIDPFGSYLYVADTQNSTIRRVSTTGNYPVITIAGIAGTKGHANGSVGTSTFFYPQALVVSPDGNYLYVSDTYNFTIRKVSTTSPYTVSTIAGNLGNSATTDGNGTGAYFSFVQALTMSTDGSILYIGDSNRVRKMTTASPYTVTTIAGTQSSPGAVDGSGASAVFNTIQGSALSKDGTLIYLSDTGNSTIRQISTSSPYTVTTLAGDPNITGAYDTGIDTYPDDTMYYYINSISLSVGKQVIQQLPGGYLKMKKDISNNYKNRPILKLLEGDKNISSSDRIYYLKTGLLNNIPMHLLVNQDVQVIVDTKIQQKSLIIDYVSFGSTKLPAQYTLIVPQVQTFHGSGLLDIKSPITKLMSDSPYDFSINGEKLFDSDTSNVSQIDNLLNVTTGYINVFRGPMNMSRIRNKAININNTPVFDSTSNTWILPGSNIWSETFNVLKIENGLSGLLFESSFYSFGAPSSYLIS